MQELARRGATLYMVCRNEERGRQALEKVKADSGNSNVHLAVSNRMLVLSGFLGAALSWEYSTLQWANQCLAMGEGMAVIE